VSVNGRIVENPDQWIDFERDKVSFDGKPLERARPRYILLYKPKGYLTTYRDPEGRPTVYSLLSSVEQFVSPVGRLDQDTSGLLLLTNDTQLAERLTNPAHHVPKTYHVKCATRLTDSDIERLRTGLELDDGPTRPAAAKRLRDTESKTFLELTITEGRNRQVRRMIEALGSHVLKLVRVRLGPLSIDTLPIGHWRELTAAEVRMLKQEAHAGKPSAATVRTGTGNPGADRAGSRSRRPAPRKSARAVRGGSENLGAVPKATRRGGNPGGDARPQG
jgi:23S rRNA pseudouridine2605 synthase